MKYLIPFLFAVILSAQTKIQVNQMQFAGFAPGCFLVVSGPKEISCIVWKSGVVAAADPNVEYGWRLPDKPEPASLIVARNGVIQDVGDDYKLDGDLIVFTQSQTSVPTDKIKCYYFVKQ